MVFLPQLRVMQSILELLLLLLLVMLRLVLHYLEHENEMSTCFHDVEGSEFYNGAVTSCYICCGFPGNIYWKDMSFSVRCTLLYSLGKW